MKEGKKGGSEKKEGEEEGKKRETNLVVGMGVLEEVGQRHSFVNTRDTCEPFPEIVEKSWKEKKKKSVSIGESTFFFWLKGNNMRIKYSTNLP